PGLLRIHRWEPFEIADCRLQIADFRTESASSDPQFHMSHSHVIDEIDLGNWLFGQLPDAVYAVGRQNPDHLQVHLGFSDGGMALIDSARTLPAGDGYFSLTLIGSAGAAYADDHHNMQLLYRGGRPSALKTGQGEIQALIELQEFVNAVAEDREPAVAGIDWRRAIQVTEAAAESIATGRAARLA